MNCPYKVSEAIILWGKACNFHRGSDMKHQCRNPPACQRRLEEAFSVELVGRGFE